MKYSKLFKDTFDKTLFSNDSKFIDFLLEEINKSELNLEKNLEAIRIDFPNLTDHSLQHSRMLWKYADLILGNKIGLNPLEGYILHMCFLIHDAGMCFSILNNKKYLQNLPIYNDFIAINGNLKNVEEEALFYCVRKLHGEFAELIPLSKLPSGKMVIEDEQLRDEFGELIGKISKSHSMDISYIDNELFSYTSPSWVHFPVNSKKLAYILRVSDAAHIDRLRTPLTQKEIKEKIFGESQNHWIFQNKIGFPRVENNLIMYNSTKSFGENEKKAWWLCFEALSVLNDELKKAAMFFSERGEDGFLVKGVKAIDNTLLLGQQYIRTNGWDSIDTKIKVSQPNLLAINVGGKRLYNYTYLALRELIQNSIDAINLRKFKQKYFEGKIIIELRNDDGDWFLYVRDNGIGMSKNILTNQLLDFGKSYWKSYDFYDEYVGLAQKNSFESIGQFGIGFYSVFMLGHKVIVSTSKFGDNPNVKNVLKFTKGLIDTPILISEKNQNVETDFGTSVCVKLQHNPYEGEGFINECSFVDNNLYSLIRYLVPDCKIDLEINENNKRYGVPKKGLSELSPSDFKTFCDLASFTKKGNLGKVFIHNKLKDLNRLLLPIFQNGRIVGRLAAIPSINRMINNYEYCIILSQGIKVAAFAGNIAGYVEISKITNLTRNQFEEELCFESIYDWTIRYIDYLKSQDNMSQEYGDINNEIKSLEYCIGELDKEETLFLYIENLNEKRVFQLNEDSLRTFIRNSDELNYYQLLDKFHENYEYNGLFDSIRPFSGFGRLIRKCDEDKLITISSLLIKILNEEWGGFTKTEHSGWDDFTPMPGGSYPYINKTVYKPLKTVTNPLPI
ncbi:ATP-binding protein [Sphingobacterium cellulitidis]|uniref:HD domain-containing protein n=1 Tax=Sphingobacterium cellulitidis TaxID=1768011 RepID=UPI00370D6C1B